MKKLTVAILAFVYLAISSGIALEIHYCMGEQAGVELYGTGDDKCGRCGMTDTKTGCCHDEYKLYKLEDSHKSVSNDISISAPETLLADHHFLYNGSMTVQAAASPAYLNSPPEDTGPSARVLHGVLRL